MIASAIYYLKGCPRRIKEMLQSMCACAKEEVRVLPAHEMRGWENAVTTAGECWPTRGQFGQNCTFIVKNYMKNTIFWHGMHACVKTMM